MATTTFQTVIAECEAFKVEVEGSVLSRVELAILELAFLRGQQSPHGVTKYLIATVVVVRKTLDMVVQRIVVIWTRIMGVIHNLITLRGIRYNL